jgi:primosomal protein N' (replication factor Y)
MILVCYLDLSHVLNPVLAAELSKKELIEQSGYSVSVLDGLVKRGILEYYEKEVGRLQVSVCRIQPPLPLSPDQERAYSEIHESFKTKEVCLLHGVTSSGKTEIYIRFISEALRLNRQVLYLLPEIAITTQITSRLAKIFGDKLLVYHSKYSDNERVEVWNKLRYGKEPRVVLGVRSSLFLPFNDLGLIIVD